VVLSTRPGWNLIPTVTAPTRTEVSEVRPRSVASVHEVAGRLFRR
jgi:hypothetical protein